MPFTVNEFEDLIRILEAQPEWRARLRALVLTDELLALPEMVRELVAAQQRTEAAVAELVVAQQRTEATVAELAAAQQRTEARVDRLDQVFAQLVEAQQRTEAHLAQLAKDVGKLRGDGVENRYRLHATAYFGTIVRRTHVLTDDERSDLFDAAMDRGALSLAEVRDIALADAIVRGLIREDQRQVYLVVEASLTVGHEDVERAARRASLLARTGVEAIPVVAGEELASGVPRQAQAAGVWQVTDGIVVPPDGRQPS
jgi:hypothetical protein